MLAKGKGYIPFEQLNSIFGLPEDAQIISAEIVDGGIEFKILSKEAIENKTVKSDSWSVRRFRPALSTEDDVIIKNEQGDVVFSTKTIGVEAIEVEKGMFKGKAIKGIVIHKPLGIDMNNTDSIAVGGTGIFPNSEYSESEGINWVKGEKIVDEQVDVSESFPMSDVTNVHIHFHETKEIMESGKKVKDIANEILQAIQRSYE